MKVLNENLCKTQCMKGQIQICYNEKRKFGLSNLCVCSNVFMEAIPRYLYIFVWRQFPNICVYLYEGEFCGKWTILNIEAGGQPGAASKSNAILQCEFIQNTSTVSVMQKKAMYKTYLLLEEVLPLLNRLWPLRGQWHKKRMNDISFPRTPHLFDTDPPATTLIPELANFAFSHFFAAPEW